VHIPDSIDVIKTIQTQIGLMTRGRGGPPPPHSVQAKVKIQSREDRKARQKLMLETKLEQMKQNLDMLTNKSEQKLAGEPS